MRPIRSTLLLPLAAALALSCAGRGPTTTAPAAPYDMAANPLPIAHTADAIPVARLRPAGPAEDLPDSELVNTAFQGTVVPDHDAVLSGGRCQLTVYAGSLPDSLDLSCSYWKAGWLQFRLQPDGTAFTTPASLVVDCTGTNVDPRSSNYDGSTPRCFFYDTGLGQWVPVPGTYDAGTRLYRVALAHFSTYAVGAKAGW